MLITLFVMINPPPFATSVISIQAHTTLDKVPYFI